MATTKLDPSKLVIHIDPYQAAQHYKDGLPYAGDVVFDHWEPVLGNGSMAGMPVSKAIDYCMEKAGYKPHKEPQPVFIVGEPDTPEVLAEKIIRGLRFKPLHKAVPGHVKGYWKTVHTKIGPKKVFVQPGQFKAQVHTALLQSGGLMYGVPSKLGASGEDVAHAAKELLAEGKIEDPNGPGYDIGTGHEALKHAHVADALKDHPTGLTGDLLVNKLIGTPAAETTLQAAMAVDNAEHNGYVVKVGGKYHALEHAPTNEHKGAFYGPDGYEKIKVSSYGSQHYVVPAVKAEKVKAGMFEMTDTHGSVKVTDVQHTPGQVKITKQTSDGKQSYTTTHKKDTLIPLHPEHFMHGADKKALEVANPAHDMIHGKGKFHQDAEFKSDPGKFYKAAKHHSHTAEDAEHAFGHFHVSEEQKQAEMTPPGEHDQAKAQTEEEHKTEGDLMHALLEVIQAAGPAGIAQSEVYGKAHVNAYKGAAAIAALEKKGSIVKFVASTLMSGKHWKLKASEFDTPAEPQSTNKDNVYAGLSTDARELVEMLGGDDVADYGHKATFTWLFDQSKGIPSQKHLGLALKELQGAGIVSVSGEGLTKAAQLNPDWIGFQPKAEAPTLVTGTVTAEVPTLGTASSAVTIETPPVVFHDKPHPQEEKAQHYADILSQWLGNNIAATGHYFTPTYLSANTGLSDEHCMKGIALLESQGKAKKNGDHYYFKKKDFAGTAPPAPSEPAPAPVAEAALEAPAAQATGKGAWKHDITLSQIYAAINQFSGEDAEGITIGKLGAALWGKSIQNGVAYTRAKGILETLEKHGWVSKEGGSTWFAGYVDTSQFGKSYAEWESGAKPVFTDTKPVPPVTEDDPVAVALAGNLFAQEVKAAAKPPLVELDQQALQILKTHGALTTNGVGLKLFPDINVGTAYSKGEKVLKQLAAAGYVEQMSQLVGKKQTKVWLLTGLGSAKLNGEEPTKPPPQAGTYKVDVAPEAPQTPVTPPAAAGPAPDFSKVKAKNLAAVEQMWTALKVGGESDTAHGFAKKFHELFEDQTHKAGHGSYYSAMLAPLQAWEKQGLVEKVGSKWQLKQAAAPGAASAPDSKAEKIKADAKLVLDAAPSHPHGVEASEGVTGQKQAPIKGGQVYITEAGDVYVDANSQATGMGTGSHANGLKLAAVTQALAKSTQDYEAKVYALLVAAGKNGVPQSKVAAFAHVPWDKGTQALFHLKAEGLAVEKKGIWFAKEFAGTESPAESDLIKWDGEHPISGMDYIKLANGVFLSKSENHNLVVAGEALFSIPMDSDIHADKAAKVIQNAIAQWDTSIGTPEAVSMVLDVAGQHGVNAGALESLFGNGAVKLALSFLQQNGLAQNYFADVWGPADDTEPSLSSHGSLGPDYNALDDNDGPSTDPADVADSLGAAPPKMPKPAKKPPVDKSVWPFTPWNGEEVSNVTDPTHFKKAVFDIIKAGNQSGLGHVTIDTVWQKLKDANCAFKTPEDTDYWTHWKKKQKQEVASAFNQLKTAGKITFDDDVTWNGKADHAWNTGAKVVEGAEVKVNASKVSAKTEAFTETLESLKAQAATAAGDTSLTTDLEYVKNNLVDQPILNLSELTKIAGKPGGTLEGGVYKGADGKKYVVKWGYGKNKYWGDDDKGAHAWNEVLAAKLLKAVGVEAPNTFVVDMGGGKFGVASEFVEGITPAKFNDEAWKKKAFKDFGAHAWIGNWDVIGTDNDNLVDTPGGPMCVDIGGSMLFRAQGKAKTEDEFNYSAFDFENMRKNTNGMAAQAAAFYGQMDAGDILTAAAKMATVSDEAIRMIVDKWAPGTSAEKKTLADKLIARKAAILASADAEAEAHMKEQASYAKAGLVFSDKPDIPACVQAVADTFHQLGYPEVQKQAATAGHFQKFGYYTKHGDNLGKIDNMPEVFKTVTGMDLASYDFNKSGLMQDGKKAHRYNTGITKTLATKKFNALPQEESAAIYGYTGSQYSAQNASLRAGKISPAANKAMKAFDKISEHLDAGAYTERGLDLPNAVVFQGLKEQIGKVIQEPGFSSTSPTAPWSNDTTLCIYAAPGARAANASGWSAHKSENELLFGANQRFLVVGVGEGQNMKGQVKKLVHLIALPTEEWGT